MAWSFQLSAECGDDRNRSLSFANHFEGLSWVLTDGIRSVCASSTHCDPEGNWWVIVCPTGISRSGVSGQTAANQLTEVGNLLYKRLRTASTFRYAIVGVESDEFRRFSELDEDLLVLPFDGLVVSDQIWKRLGSPHIFVPFSTGYYWRPYKGEKPPQET